MRGLAWCFAVWALASVAQADVGFLEALTIAQGEMPSAAAVDIARADGHYRVRFPTREGNVTLAVDAARGNIVRRELVALDPVRGAHTPAVLRSLRNATIDLAGAIRLAERYGDGPLVRVALQVLDGRVVVETQHWDGQSLVGRVIDPAREVAIVGPPGEPARVPQRSPVSEGTPAR
jgi:hypothetical protein